MFPAVLLTTTCKSTATKFRPELSCWNCPRIRESCNKRSPAMCGRGLKLRRGGPVAGVRRPSNAGVD